MSRKIYRCCKSSLSSLLNLPLGTGDPKDLQGVNSILAKSKSILKVFENRSGDVGARTPAGQPCSLLPYSSLVGSCLDVCKVLYEEGAAFFNTYLLLTQYFILKGLRHQLFIIYHCSSQHCPVSWTHGAEELALSSSCGSDSERLQHAALSRGTAAELSWPENLPWSSRLPAVALFVRHGWDSACSESVKAAGKL